MRTGVSRSTMALDPEALQNQTATASAMAADQAHSKTEEYARNIANFGGLKRFFSCCLKLITKYQDRPRTIRLRGEWVAMDPRGWDADMDVTVNVGLGTGTRDRDIAMLMGVRNAQKEYVGIFGPFNEFCNIGHISDTDRKMAEAAGLSNPDSYFPNISQEKIAEMRAQSAQKQPPPDPRMMEMQAKLQLQQAELKADIERKAFSGAVVNASVEIWAQDNKFGKRINATLIAVQFQADDEPLGGGHVTHDQAVEGFDFDETEDF